MRSIHHFGFSAFCFFAICIFVLARVRRTVLRPFVERFQVYIYINIFIIIIIFWGGVLRVHPTVTRLTVHRRSHVDKGSRDGWTKCRVWKVGFSKILWEMEVGERCDHAFRCNFFVDADSIASWACAGQIYDFYGATFVKQFQAECDLRSFDSNSVCTFFVQHRFIETYTFVFASGIYYTSSTFGGIIDWRHGARARHTKPRSWPNHNTCNVEIW